MTELIRGAWVQDPDTLRLVPKHQYERRERMAAESMRLRSELPSPLVMRDIEPFRNVAVDGGMITSRSEKREMMRRNGLTEIGNELRVTKRKPRSSKRTVVQDIKRSLQELQSR